MSIVSVHKLNATASGFISMSTDLPELKLGWPLLRRSILPNTTSSSNPSKIYVVQWVMRLPSRYLSIESSSTKENESECELDGGNGAICPVGDDAIYVPSSLDSNSRSIPEELEGFHEKYSATCRLFKFNELVSATSNFLPENLIDRGGSSRVYRGFLPDGRELAVKIINPSEDSLKEFVLEIEIITTLHHKNIISLFGFYFEENNFLLVYDFLSRGSLEENLHGMVNTIMYGEVNEKIDIYAYGVVLLELMSRRMPISSGYPKGQESLVMWVLKLLQGDVEVTK